MAMKKQIAIVIVSVLLGLTLGIALVQKRNCSRWHNMPITTNEDKIKQNELHRKNGWQVNLQAYWFPYPMSNMTVEVCKHCGKATAVRMEVKVQ